MKTTPKSRLLGVAASVLTLVFSATTAAFGATQAQIDQAIDDGLLWLATQQRADGSFGPGFDPYPLAHTAAAVLAFENEGHFPGGGTAYSVAVERGLDYILNRARKTGIAVQPAGDPDSNGNGFGVSWWDSSHSREVYETGMIMQALVASSTPDRLVNAGQCAGMTYRQVMEDVVDWAAFGQEEQEPWRGGWRYFANYGNSDNSTAQWPVLGLIAAQQWGISAPPFVKSELELWIHYIQNANGGSGYSSPDSMVNPSKTGGLLVEMYYVGDESTTARAQSALGYLDAHWGDPPSGWDGNKGNSYAMFSIFKGLELMEVPSMSSAPATPDTPAGDWYGDYAQYLVNTQLAYGAWPPHASFDSHLSTAWNVVILQATIFPVDVEVEVPDCACDSGYLVDVSYSIERFPASGMLTLLEDGVMVAEVPVVDFQGSTTQPFTVASDTPGPHDWTAVLSVTGGGGVNSSAEDSDTINICETPQVSGVPDQVAPFQPFDLDDSLSYGGPGPVTWSIDGVPADWVVSIDADNVVAVMAPPGAMDPVDLTFTASVGCCDEVVCASADTATFVPNQPPDCSDAFASIELLWPPNHKWVPIEVLGVVDPDGDPVTITIDAIWQDEPVDDRGDGRFSPDGRGVGSATAGVRSERSGRGNGRVYHIAFTADDGRGGFCRNEVMVGVPHDKKDLPRDDGANFDSTTP